MATETKERKLKNQFAPDNVLALLQAAVAKAVAEHNRNALSPRTVDDIKQASLRLERSSADAKGGDSERKLIIGNSSSAANRAADVVWSLLGQWRRLDAADRCGITFIWRRDEGETGLLHSVESTGDSLARQLAHVLADVPCFAEVPTLHWREDSVWTSPPLRAPALMDDSGPVAKPGAVHYRVMICFGPEWLKHRWTWRRRAARPLSSSKGRAYVRLLHAARDVDADLKQLPLGDRVAQAKALIQQWSATLDAHDNDGLARLLASIHDHDPAASAALVLGANKLPADAPTLLRQQVALFLTYVDGHDPHTNAPRLAAARSSNPAPFLDRSSFFSNFFLFASK